MKGNVFHYLKLNPGCTEFLCPRKEKRLATGICQGKMSITNFLCTISETRASYFQGCFPACCNSEHQTWNSFSAHNCRCYTLCINEGHRTGRDNMNNSLWQSQEGLSAGLSARWRLSFHPVSPCWHWVLVWRGDGGEEDWWERCVGCGWRRIMQWISSSFLSVSSPLVSSFHPYPLLYRKEFCFHLSVEVNGTSGQNLWKITANLQGISMHYW